MNIGMDRWADGWREELVDESIRGMGGLIDGKEGWMCGWMSA